MSLRIRLTIVFVMLVAIPVFLVGSTAMGNATDLTIQSVARHMLALSKNRKATLSLFIDDQINLYKSISSRTKLREMLGSLPSAEDLEGTVAIMEQILADAIEPFDAISAIQILSPEGDILVEVGGSLGLEEYDYVRAQAISIAHIEPHVFFSQDLSTLHVIGPIFRDEELLGLLLFQTDKSLITDIMTDYEGLGDTGEMLIAQRDVDGNAQFVHQRRFEFDDRTVPVIDKTELQVPMTQALLKREETFFDVVDYRGEAVVAATRYIPETDWGMVLKIDRVELLKELERFRGILMIVVTLIVVLTGLISYAIALSLTRPIIHLTEASSRIAQGDFSASVDADIVAQPDEIGMLGTSMAEMGKNLSSMYTSLEKRVLERTKALDAKIQELETLNDLMLGREEKMIALKKELKSKRKRT